VERFVVPAKEQRKLPFHGERVAIRDHAVELERGVDVHQRERDVPEERLPGEP
jgi:hypothetical protein